MAKDFDRWNKQKKQTDEIKNEPVLFYEREVWWCAAGINIGVEIDGKHELFSRPIAVIRKFNKDMLLVAPTTAQDKSNKYYLLVSGDDGKTYNVCLSQIRTISSKRLLRKIGTISESDYRTLLEKLADMVKGLL